MKARDMTAWGCITKAIGDGEGAVEVRDNVGFTSTVVHSQSECSSVSLWKQIHSDMSRVLSSSLWGSQAPTITNSPLASSPQPPASLPDSNEDEESDLTDDEELERELQRASKRQRLYPPPTSSSLPSPPSLPSSATLAKRLSDYDVPSNIHIIELDICLSKKLPFPSGSKKSWTNTEREKVKATVRKPETHEEFIELVCTFCFHLQHFTDLSSFLRLRICIKMVKEWEMIIFSYQSK
jgi:hypothetical protein